MNDQQPIPTPRTDAETFMISEGVISDCIEHVVRKNFACTLERELAQKEQERDRLRTEIAERDRMAEFNEHAYAELEAQLKQLRAEQ